MDKKEKVPQKPLIARLQLQPEDTEVPHMVKGKFIMPEQTSNTEEDENPLPFSVEISPFLRTAVYKADSSRKNKRTTKEGKMGFEYILSKMHKEKAKQVVCQSSEMAGWDLRSSMDYSELTNKTGKKFSMIPSHDELSCTTDTSADISTVTEGKYNS
uniref:Uncharacterized protein n=1 Tax=Sphaerodactylus townsendi TaxID=933632 RepID=A0ACB8GA61_9SAUR